MPFSTCRLNYDVCAVEDGHDAGITAFLRMPGWLPRMRGPHVSPGKAHMKQHVHSIAPKTAGTFRSQQQCSATAQRHVLHESCIGPHPS